MKRAVFGSSPDSDKNPEFARWWQSLPAEFKVAKGDARRAWQKLRPSPELAQLMTEAVQAQAQTEKWKAGYFTTPAKWIRGERWEDPVPAPKGAEDWRCQHQPACYNSAAHMVRLAKERGEV